MTIEVKSIHEPRLGSTRHRVREAAAHARQAYRLRRLLFAAAIVPLILVSVVLAYSYHNAARLVDERLASGYLTSRAGIYAAPRVLRPGQSLSRERLVETLRRAGYVENAASNVWNGAFAVKEQLIEILPRQEGGEPQPEEGTTVPGLVKVAFDGRSRIESLIADGAAVESFALEPEALTHDAATKTSERSTLDYEHLPPVLVQAILATEDRRFFEHQGIDPTGVGRALLSWTGWGTSSDGMQGQGGSTITQQLVKNTYLTPERTLRRKYHEALLASALERRLSKQDILALYCNEIYLGQRGTFAVRGVGQAARVYFGKELKNLSLAEAAIIAGMIRSPNRYAPDRHPEQAAMRRNTVLDAMLRDGHVTPEQAQAASHEPITVAPATGGDDATAPHFVDYVNRMVEAKLASRSEVDERSLRVHTTIDLDLQRLAEAAARRQLEKLEQVYEKRGVRPQIALVAMEAGSGHVLAMVGGRHYGESQLNRATDARRQPGSVFKPFVYAAALESGLSPVSLSADAPREFTYDVRATYRPANYGGAYSNREVTLRTGLIKSLNVVTVDAAMRAGLPRVAALVERFGLAKPAPYPALALGTSEATPLEIASAYTAFANGGPRARATAVSRAFDAAGQSIIEEPSSAPDPAVIRPATAYMITDMLAGVINQGTARAARGTFKHTAVAGKTGTSRDGWFAGYTPRLVCIVWVGFDDNSQLGLTGAESALPVWSEFMKGALELRPELGGAAFARPDSITTIEIDSETGLRAAPSCPHRERIAITHAFAPGFECYKHQPPLEMLATNDVPGVGLSPLGEPTDSLAGTAMPEPERVRVPSLRAVPVGKATRIETGANGRPRLINEVRIEVEGPEQQ